MYRTFCKAECFSRSINSLRMIHTFAARGIVLQKPLLQCRIQARSLSSAREIPSRVRMSRFEEDKFIDYAWVDSKVKSIRKRYLWRSSMH